jgi:hypothetical protein
MLQTHDNDVIFLLQCLVPGVGFEPTCLAAAGFEATEYTFSPPGPNGAEDRARTGDLFHTKKVLYPLSYVGWPLLMYTAGTHIRKGIKSFSVRINVLTQNFTQALPPPLSSSDPPVRDMFFWCASGTSFPQHYHTHC